MLVINSFSLAFATIFLLLALAHSSLIAHRSLYIVTSLRSSHTGSHIAECPLTDIDNAGNTCNFHPPTHSLTRSLAHH
jgi:hypothetical protein